MTSAISLFFIVGYQYRLLVRLEFLVEYCNHYLDCYLPDPDGIESGDRLQHIAFNDPPVADFFDPYFAKEVALDDVCRMQQVHDGCFESFEKVPEKAITLTVPALLRTGKLICVVPGPTKANAVFAMLYGPIGTACPATALRLHPDATLYLDAAAAANLR